MRTCTGFMLIVYIQIQPSATCMLLRRGDARLQHLEPVQDNVDLGLWFLLDHDEVLSVGRNVVVRRTGFSDS